MVTVQSIVRKANIDLTHSKNMKNKSTKDTTVSIEVRKKYMFKGIEFPAEYFWI